MSLQSTDNSTCFEPASLSPVDLDYHLPPELIAQQPLPQRDRSRLLVLDRRRGTLRDHHFYELPGLIESHDMLVVNDTRVIPAKFHARRATGGALTGLFLRQAAENVWEVMLTKSGRIKPGEKLALQPEDGDSLRLVERRGDGKWLAELVSASTTLQVLDRLGSAPLPPYIRRSDKADDHQDRRQYQTLYAKHPGAVAAPTAGLHFTSQTLRDLEAKCIQTANVTLHVGAGTFAPMTVDNLDDHPMHAEWFELNERAANQLTACRARGGRVVAVGTTTARVLESSGTTTVRALESSVANGRFAPRSGWTDLFIRPPYTFHNVDVLVTNFHLPRSTLLAMVMAFAGRDRVQKAYQHAIAQRYRFYSFGDAMLIV